jgi:hypothetical protein
MRARNVAGWLLFTCLLADAVSAYGQTTLRWKLKPGDSLAVTLDQQTDSTVAFSGKSAKTDIILKLSLGWNVMAADNTGFKIRQSIDGIQQKLTTQQAGTIEFDSKSKAKPTGQSRDLADALRPLVGAEFDMTMTPRGEITAVEPANEAAKALFAGLQSGQTADAAALASVEQMLKRPLLVLPERATSVGETWSASSERPTVAGPLKIDTTYKLAGLADQNGQPIARIAMSATFTPAAGGQLIVKSPEHSGEIAFAVDDGRLIEITQQQKLTTERPYRETTIVVTLASQQTTTVVAK